MSVSLQDWERKGWVEKHKSSPQEIEELFHIADRDLKDCQTTDLSDDWSSYPHFLDRSRKSG